MDWHLALVVSLTFGMFYKVLDGWSHLVHESSAHDTMDSATKKSALTKQAPDSTWDEVNRVWLGKEAMRECTSQEKA